MSTMKKQLSVVFLFIVGVVVATMKGMLIVMLKRLLAFGIVASVVAMLHLTADKDSTAVATRPHSAKPLHQVAQGNAQKPNPADKLAGPVAPAPSGSAAITPSAPLGAGPIQAARNAAAAQNAQLAKETGQAVPAPKGAPAQTVAATPTPPAPTPAPAQTPAPAHAAPSQGTQVVQQGAPKSAASNNSVEAPVMRESFDYSRDTRRDPFVSLMTTSDLRPTLTDLRLTGILYDLSGRRPVAILRDIAGGQWRVTTGMTLGRMRVTQIKPKTIIFTIEEFGFNRQDSLILGDTSRVRHR
jgi:hypothetical protein